MKLLAEKNFSWRDRRREVMLTISRGEIFEVDESDIEEAKDIYSLLQSGVASVADDKFIKQEGEYIGVHLFEERRSDGTWLRIRPGHSIKLRQAEASRLMARGFVRPERDSTWSPKKLLAGGISVREPKKMFDDLVSTGQNWVRKGMR